MGAKITEASNPTYCSSSEEEMEEIKVNGELFCPETQHFVGSLSNQEGIRR